MAEPTPDTATPAVLERHITLENALNFRDVGGYPTTDGRHVRWRRMFRAGGLSDLTPAEMLALGAVKVVDLVNENTSEREAMHHAFSLIRQRIKEEIIPLFL